MMRTSSFRFVASSLAVLALAASCSLRTPAPSTTAEVARQLNQLAIPFVENAGQSDPRVAYYAPTFSGTVFVTGEGEVVYALPAPGDRAQAAGQERASGWTLTESFVDGHATPVGADAAATHLSVFVGHDPASWKPDVAGYADVALGAVWPGISVTLAAHGKQVEKVFTVEPGAAPDAIRVRVAGSESLAVADDGALVAHTGVGDVRLTPPVAYQDFGGRRQILPAAYEIAGDEYGFRVRDYDPTRPVVIDPLLQATFLGGSNEDDAFALAIEPTTGDVYVAGVASSINFPGTSGGAQRLFGGVADAFVARLNPSLTALEQATYLGGSGDDRARALAIEPTTGDVIIAGRTESSNFPGTNGGAQSALRGDADAFVARLSASLTSLDQATYLGGSFVRQSGSRETVTALTIAPATGDVYVTGATESTDFPGTRGGAQSISGGGVLDGFVARLNADLTTLDQATYLGGDGNNDVPLGLALAPATGDVYVTGRTDSDDLPGTQGGAQSTFGGGALAASSGFTDAFVARLNAGLTSIEQATYLGGSSPDEGAALAIAPTTGDVYVAGFADSADFPGTTGGAQAVHDGGNRDDGFVARLNAALTSLDQTTYLGGGGSDISFAMQLTTSEVYVAGGTKSNNFPGTVGGAQSTLSGAADAFVARLNLNLTAIHQASYLGGSFDDGARALMISPTTGDVYIAGFTLSPVFPHTAGGAQGAFGGAQDAFVARLSADLSATATTTSTTTTSSTASSTSTSTSTSTTTIRPTTTTTSTTRPTTTSTTTSTSTSTSTTTTTTTTTTTSTTHTTTTSTSTTPRTTTSTTTTQN